MRYEYLELSYRLAHDGAALQTITLLLSGLEAGAAHWSRQSNLDVGVSLDDPGVVAVSVVAHEAVRLQSCALTLGHDFAEDESVLMNGYQSWTDTHPHTVHERMRGLNGVAPSVVKSFSLDGSGDYRFVDYADSPGCFHGFTYAAFSHRVGLAHPTWLVASLDESGGFTLVRADASRQAVTVEFECPVSSLHAGDEYVVGKFAVLSTVDAPDGVIDVALYDRWFSLANVKARPVKPLVGYTSWYRHYANISEGALRADLEGACAVLEDVRDLDVRAVFQIDDGFCKVGDWLDVDEQRFPEGLAPLAQSIRTAGLTPGLWLAPFVCERESRLFSEHPDWLLRDDDGNLCDTGSHWSGGVALDIANPDVCAYVSDVVRTVVEDWGFGLLKLDFLYGACMVAHAGCNRGELMAKGIDLLREAAGEECLLLGCGVPLGSAFGKLDYCRVGCDMGLGWDGDFVLRHLQRERVSTRNSLFNTVARCPLDGRAFGNDPDVFFLRREGLRLSLEQRQMLIGSAASFASVLLTSDDMGAWDKTQREWFRAAVEILAERKCV